jgi:hypothetical protein
MIGSTMDARRREVDHMDDARGRKTVARRHHADREAKPRWIEIDALNAPADPETHEIEDWNQDAIADAVDSYGGIHAAGGVSAAGNGGGQHGR